MKNLTNVIRLISKHTNQMSLFVDGRLITPQERINNQINSIINMKKFVIDDYEAILLSKTKTELEIVKMPFDDMYIDLNLTLKNIRIIGLIIKNVKPHLHYKNIEDIFIMGFYINESDNWVGCFECSVLSDEIVGLNYENPRRLIKDNDIQDGTLKSCGDKNTDNQKYVEINMKYFVVNLLKFITEPDVEILELSYNERTNEKRMKKGKIPITNMNYIRVNGILKQYVNCFKNISIEKLQNSHWVRGHWRVFKSKRYKQMKDKKIWILPHIRGSGELIEKAYEIRKKYIRSI